MSRARTQGTCGGTCPRTSKPAVALVILTQRDHQGNPVSLAPERLHILMRRQIEGTPKLRLVSPASQGHPRQRELNCLGRAPTGHDHDTGSYTITRSNDVETA